MKDLRKSPFNTTTLWILVLGILTASVALALVQRQRTISGRDGQDQLQKGSVIQVGRNDNFQQALNRARPGDTLVLQAGAVYVGPFTLPVKSGAEFITVQSSRVGELPEGVRVSPSQSPLFAKLQSATNGEAILKTQAGAHHYKFIGIEFSTTNAKVLVYDLLRFGDTAQTSLASVPHHLVIDRCYIHGFATQEVQRGISLNSAETAVINSHISDIHGRGYDTQAICGWNGPGPFQIINNYLEGAGENVMFGGADPKITNLVPSDIEIRRNHFFKPLSWKKGDPSFVPLPPLPGSSLDHWSVKNLFELKNARRVVIDGNVFENNWIDAQAGRAILFTVRNDGGTAPWSIVEDITFTNNTLKNSPAGVSLLGKDDLHPSQQSRNLKVINNLFVEGLEGAWLTMTGFHHAAFEHNTHFQGGNIMSLYGSPSLGFIYRNNLTVRGPNGYGVFGDSEGEGRRGLDRYCPGAIFAGNIIAAANQNIYPSGNFYPAALAGVQLGPDYRLLPTSPFKNKGTDGKDPGADMTALEAAQAGTGAVPMPTATPSPIPTQLRGQLP